MLPRAAIVALVSYSSLNGCARYLCGITLHVYDEVHAMDYVPSHMTRGKYMGLSVCIVIPGTLYVIQPNLIDYEVVPKPANYCTPTKHEV